MCVIENIPNSPLSSFLCESKGLFFSITIFFFTETNADTYIKKVDGVNIVYGRKAQGKGSAQTTDLVQGQPGTMPSLEPANTDW